jgi:hypothetical protein
MRLPPANSRVAFVGPTRCGKTYLARAWLRFYPHVIVIDPKRQWDWKDKDERFKLKSSDWKTFGEQLRATADKKDEHYGYPIVWRPPADELTPEDLDRVYEVAFHRGHTLVYMDELYFLTDAGTGGSRAKWFRACVTAGASRGVGCWSSFQRPAWVPLIALTETEVRAIFYLRNASDRKRIDDSFCESDAQVPWQELRPTPQSRYKFVLSTDAWLSKPTRIKPQE